MTSTLDTSVQILHGPMKTSRLGRLVSFDVTAPQRNMVVERGSSLPRASLVVTTGARKLIELSKNGEKLDSIIVLGSDSDPAEHPDLREITENLRALRDKWFSRAKLCIITSVRDLESYDRRATLGLFDRVYIQFEWGTAKAFTNATGQKGTLLAGLTKQLGSLDHVHVQANFSRGEIDNSTASEVTQWIKKLQEVKPQEVHVLTGGGPKLGKKTPKAITPSRRKEIVELISEVGLNVSVHDDEVFREGAS